MKKIGIFFLSLLLLVGCGNSKDEESNRLDELKEIFAADPFETDFSNVEDDAETSIVYIMDTENSCTISSYLNKGEVFLIAYYDTKVGSEGYYTIYTTSDKENKLSDDQKKQKESFDSWEKSLSIDVDDLKLYIEDYYKENK